MHTRNHLIKQVIALFCASFIMIVSLADLSPYQTQALTTNNFLKVDIIKQEKTNWCWAACAEMAGRYICGYPFLGIGYRNQSNIVKHVKGSTDNLSGSLSDSVKGSTYAAKDTKKFSYTSTTWSWSKLRQEVNDKKIVQLGAGYYQNGVRNGGHVVVLSGWSLNTSFDKYYIYYCDPWDGTETYCEYDAFLDGSFNGRKYDQTIYIT